MSRSALSIFTPRCGDTVFARIGDPDLDPAAEKPLCRAIVEKAVEALQTGIEEQKLFARPT